MQLLNPLLLSQYYRQERSYFIINIIIPIKANKISLSDFMV